MMIKARKTIRLKSYGRNAQLMSDIITDIKDIKNIGFSGSNSGS
jgi:hypothetical protein